ncbi:MAG: hypothetical protein FD174_3471 [Geobacteraceae bacterium]|nr:MAG: hypothetical protein FD174_3471 [Geobacteraceae bacterium]
MAPQTGIRSPPGQLHKAFMKLIDQFKRLPIWQKIFGLASLFGIPLAIFPQGAKQTYDVIKDSVGVNSGMVRTNIETSPGATVIQNQFNVFQQPPIGLQESQKARKPTATNRPTHEQTPAKNQGGKSDNYHSNMTSSTTHKLNSKNSITQTSNSDSRSIIINPDNFQPSKPLPRDY